MPLRSKTRAEKLRAQVGSIRATISKLLIFLIRIFKKAGQWEPSYTFLGVLLVGVKIPLQQKVGRFSDSSDKKNNVLRTLQSRQANFWRLRKPIARNPLRIAEQLSGEEVIASFFSSRKRRGGIVLFSWPLSRHWNTC